MERYWDDLILSAHLQGVERAVKLTIEASQIAQR